MTGLDRLRELADRLDKSMRGRREALIGMELRAIADQIEAEQDERITRRVEDREGAEWVREHGGIAYVKDAWNVRSNLDRRLEKEQAKVERQQRHIEFVQGKCRERKERICELNRLNRAYRDALNGVCKRLGLTDGTGLPDMPEVIWTELDRRLMPEGMEWLVEAWPRFEDGEPVRFLDDFERYGDENGVSAVTMYPDGSFALNFRAYSNGERAKRPAPKVLDADGEEIRAGEMLFHVMSGDGVTARQLMPPDKFEDTEFIRHFASEYTHRAPVLAADGRPLREGEKAYELESGDELAIVEVVNKNIVKCKIPGELGIWSRLRTAMSLTHERPDSWERLEADAGKNPFDYCKDVGHRLDTCENSEAYKARDLVRRAKALAERGAR